MAQPAVDFWCRHCAGSRLGKSPPGQSRGISGVVEQQAMRNGQQHHHNKRMRGRNNNNSSNNNRRNQNPLTRVYESNGPDVKIRGTANHVAEKYLQLARDCPVLRRSGLGRKLLPARRTLFPPDRGGAGAVPPAKSELPAARPEGAAGNDQQFQPRSDEQFEEGGDEDGQPFGQQAFGTRERSPTCRRTRSPSCSATTTLSAARAARAAAGSSSQPRVQQQQPEPGNEAGLPAFITGGAPQAATTARPERLREWRRAAGPFPAASPAPAPSRPARQRAGPAGRRAAGRSDG